MLTTREKKKLQKIKVGDIYWDCAYHPVLCTESNGDDVAGVSLIDGSQPRSCSIRHCGVSKLNADQVATIIKNRETLILAEKLFRADVFMNGPHAYWPFQSALESSGYFPKWEG